MNAACRDAEGFWSLKRAGIHRADSAGVGAAGRTQVRSGLVWDSFGIVDGAWIAVGNLRGFRVLSIRGLGAVTASEPRLGRTFFQALPPALARVFQDIVQFLPRISPEFPPDTLP
ncbi:MAG: hypothetical protein EBS01_13940 [Verrucomicrobia bacterium]|nr:hypothetical protein [Verrucomicrobiota bacterium]